MPTFHFFKNSQRIDEIQGADPAGLEQKIKEHHVKVKSWGGGAGRSLKDDNSPSSPAPVQVNLNQPPIRPNAGHNVGSNAGANVQPLEQFIEMLISMGFSQEVSAKALIATNNRSLEDAIDWIDAHPQDNQPSSDAPPSAVPQNQPADVMELDDEEAEDLAALLAARNASKKPAATESTSENSTPVTSEQVIRPDDQKTVVELSWEERQKKFGFF